MGLLLSPFCALSVSVEECSLSPYFFFFFSSFALNMRERLTSKRTGVFAVLESMASVRRETHT